MTGFRSKGISFVVALIITIDIYSPSFAETIAGNVGDAPNIGHNYSGKDFPPLCQGSMQSKALLQKIITAPTQDDASNRDPITWVQSKILAIISALPFQKTYEHANCAASCAIIPSGKQPKLTRIDYLFANDTRTDITLRELSPVFLERDKTDNDYFRYEKALIVPDPEHLVPNGGKLVCAAIRNWHPKSDREIQIIVHY